MGEMRTAKKVSDKTAKTMSKKRLEKDADKSSEQQREKKLALKETWQDIVQKEKSLLVAMAIVAVASVIMLVVALIVVLRPQDTVVITGYGDVYGEIAGLSGGYRRMSWLNMLAFPVLALMFGTVQNVLVMRVYRKYGRDLALVLAIATLLLIVGALIVLFRVAGEW